MNQSPSSYRPTHGCTSSRISLVFPARHSYPGSSAAVARALASGDPLANRDAQLPGRCKCDGKRRKKGRRTCRDRDSNPDGPSTAQRILSPLRLPIPPSRQNRTRANREESYATTGRCPTRESSPRRHRASTPVRAVPARLHPGTIRGGVRSRLARGRARIEACGPQAPRRSDERLGARDRGAVRKHECSECRERGPNHVSTECDCHHSAPDRGH